MRKKRECLYNHESFTHRYHYLTQGIYKNRQKFYNPIRQNYGHIEALKSLLNLSKNNI
ncbi:NERD domain-containing protein [Sporosarcina sp. P25]|uniref:NERD domain-containing protein n=1 Tax=unclassified Sporosarcina TaxID=2647733 RepID=UPI003512B8CD